MFCITAHAIIDEVKPICKVKDPQFGKHNENLYLVTLISTSSVLGENPLILFYMNWGTKALLAARSGSTAAIPLISFLKWFPA